MSSHERPFYQDPVRYLEHLHQTPQLTAPPEVLLLSAIALSVETHHPPMTTFENWLMTQLGQEVLRRITNNQHNVALDQRAAVFDTVGDVQQKALLWLWLRWARDPDFVRLRRFTQSFSHEAGYLTRMAVLNAHCRYSRRRWEFVQPALEWGEGLIEEQTIDSLDDSPTLQVDTQIDVTVAIERVVQRMQAAYADVPRRTSIEHITRTIIEGYLHYYEDRYQGKGSFRYFCELQGVGKNVIQKWRPIIFNYLREELADYATL